TGTFWENDDTQASCNHGFASHAAVLILRDCLGVERVDYLNRVLYLNDDFRAPRNAAATIPSKEGTAAVIRIKDGVRTVELKGGFTLG
ncbi:MAG: hypothetical protein J6X30_02175, partial [Clostridia bacterium]|nr:hypothetical protein [Clostridia bacterium]